MSERMRASVWLDEDPAQKYTVTLVKYGFLYKVTGVFNTKWWIYEDDAFNDFDTRLTKAEIRLHDRAE